MPTDPFTKIIESAQTAAEALTGKTFTQPEVLTVYAHSFAQRGLLFGFARFNRTTQCWNLSQIALSGDEADSWQTWTRANLNADTIPAAQAAAFTQALEQQQPVFFDRSVTALAPFLMRPFAEDGEYPPTLSLPSFVTPVTAAGETFGALVCAGEHLSTENLPAIQTVARELALRLENARLRAVNTSQHGRQTLALTSISEAVHLFDDVKSPILALNHDWEILYCNQAYAAFVKRPKEELIGENLLAIFPGFESRPSFQTYQLALQTGDAHVLEGRAPNHHYLRAQIIPAPWGLLAIAEDITEERRSQAALAESEQRYRTLFEASNDAIFLTAENGDILDCNLRACSMSGYAKAELLGMHFHQLFLAQEGFTLARAEHRTLDGKNLEIYILPKDDHRFPAEMNVRQVQVQDQQAFVIYVRDIRERKEAELALRASEQKFRSFIQQSTDGLVLVDANGLVLEWNKGQEQITQIPRAQAVGHYIWDVQASFVQPNRSPEEFKAQIKATLARITGGEDWPDTVYPHRLNLSDGVLQFVESRSFPVSTDRGIIVGSIIRDITHNKTLEQDLRRRIEEAETLRRATAALASSLDLDQVLDRILHQLKQVVPFDSAGVFLLEKDALIGVAGLGSLDFDSLIGKKFSAANPLLAEVGRNKHPKVLKDAQESPYFEKWAKTDHVRGWMGIPLLLHNKVIGFLTCDSLQVDAYTESDVALAETFAAQAAIAIANARHMESERKQLLLAQTLQEVGASLISQLSLEETLEQILDLLARVVQYDSVSITLLQADGVLEMAAGRGFADPEAIRRVVCNLSFHMLSHKHNTLETLVIPDVLENELWVAHPASGPVRSYIGAPLQIKQRLIGVLNVDSWTPNHYDEDTAKTVAAFANQAAIAIENANLYKQTTAERRNLSLLYLLSREIGASLDPDDILKRTIHLSCQVLNGLVGQAFIYDPQEQRLALRAVYGEEQRRQNALLIHHTQRPWIGLTGWVAEHHQAVYVPDVYEDERWVHVPGIDDEVRSALFAPIVFDDQLLGVISVYHRLKDAFSNDYLDLIQAICQQVGLALSNARRYQQTQQRLSEIMFIQSMSQTFNKRLSKRELLEEVVTQLVIQGNYSDARIYLAEGAQLTLAAARGPQPSTPESGFCRQLAEQALAQGAGILIPDLPQHTAGEEIDTDSGSLLTLPIFRENTAIGALQVAGELPNQITTHDREVLALLCGQISVALENAILYDHIRSHADELERIVAQKTSELTALYKLSQEIGYQISFDELLSLVLEHLYNAISGDVVAGCLLVERGGALIISAARPLSDQALAQIRSAYEQMLHESGGAAETAPKIVLRPVESYCEPCPVIAKLNSVIVAPVFLDNKMAGTLIVASEQKHFLGAEEMRLLTTFANQAATAAQRLHALLMAQQQHLEDVFTHMPVGVLLIDENRALLSSNPRGRSNLSDINGDAGAGSLERLGTLTFEELIAHQNDSLPFTVNTFEPMLRTFEVQVRPVGAKDSRQWVITLREVTQEREYQERIQSQERLATVGQLAAGIAHDFNNIMAAILVYADLLRYDASLPAASRDKVTIIQQQVQRAASLIRQILDFSRRSVMEQSRLNLLPFIKELDKLLGRVLPETIELQLHYQPGVYYINADPTRLQQVFMNLALNARDAMPNGGVLRFELGRIFVANSAEAPVPDMPPGEWIRVRVKDTGHGIPQSVRAHIFEPFYTTKPVGQGTGLGLAQVYGIIKQHDGFVDVESRPNQGATFILYLPALEFGKTGELPPLETELNMGSGERILVVEDDISTRQAIQALLEAHNYRVLTAADGQVALDLLTAEGSGIALVISDLVMPRMGGVELYRALKAQNWQGKILFVTGHPLEGDYQHLLEKGEVEWLNKPFSVQALTRAVRQQLQR